MPSLSCFNSCFVLKGPNRKSFPGLIARLFTVNVTALSPIGSVVAVTFLTICESIPTIR